jgi:hypothetical protein
MKSLSKALAVCGLVLMAAACVTPLPPSPQEVAAKRFEPVPGKAVVYVFRDLVNFGGVQAPVALDGNQIGTTYGGTFLYVVVDPGTRRLTGMFGDAGSMQFSVQAGELYFIQQNVTVNFGMVNSFFGAVSAAEGRNRVSQYQLANN